MNAEDNELTSLTWLHSINILPRESNKVSNKNKTEGFCIPSPKNSSEKKDVNQVISNGKRKKDFNSTECISKTTSSLPSSPTIEKSHRLLSSPVDDNNAISERCSNSFITSRIVRTPSKKDCKTEVESTIFIPPSAISASTSGFSNVSRLYSTQIKNRNIFNNDDVK